MGETFKNVLLISSKRYGKGMRRVKQNKMLLNKIHRTKKGAPKTQMASIHK